MKFVSKNEIIKIIDDVEKDYLLCWEMLKKIMYDKFDINNIIKFQPTLANAIYKADQLHYTFCKEEKYLIKQKHRYNHNWFKNKMNKLKNYKINIANIIDIGKCIGDGYMWIFYKNDTEKIESYSKSPKVSHMSNGLGTLGEIEFIKSNPFFNGMLVLYHGISNFLNIGDVSLYSVQYKKIVAIGEIKTKKESDTKITVGIDFLSKVKFNLNETENGSINRNKEYDNYIVERLNRQLTNMENVLNSKEMENNIDRCNTQYYYKNLENVCKKSTKNKVGIEKCCNSLYLICVDNTINSLSDTIESHRSLGKLIDTINLDKIKQIINEDSKYNSLRLFEIVLQYRYGQVPLIHWDVDIDVLKDIVFKKKYVMSLVNQSEFVEYFVKQGYSVEIDGKHNIKFYKVIKDGYVKSLENMQTYLKLLGYSLMSIEDIFSTIEESNGIVEEKIISGEIPLNAKVEFKVVQKGH